MFPDFLRAVEFAYTVEYEKLTSAREQGLLSAEEADALLGELNASAKPLQKALQFDREEDERNAWSERSRKPFREAIRQYGGRQVLRDLLRPPRDPFDAYRPGW